MLTEATLIYHTEPRKTELFGVDSSRQTALLNASATDGVERG